MWKINQQAIRRTHVWNAGNWSVLSFYALSFFSFYIQSPLLFSFSPAFLHGRIPNSFLIRIGLQGQSTHIWSTRQIRWTRIITTHFQTSAIWLFTWWQAIIDTTCLSTLIQVEAIGTLDSITTWISLLWIKFTYHLWWHGWNKQHWCTNYRLCTLCYSQRDAGENDDHELASGMSRRTRSWVPIRIADFDWYLWANACRPPTSSISAIKKYIMIHQPSTYIYNTRFLSFTLIYHHYPSLCPFLSLSLSLLYPIRPTLCL